MANGLLRDFTIEKYQALCEAIVSSGYETITLKEYFLNDAPERYVIMRHDVDTSPSNASRIAGIENGMGIKATYYFRPNRTTFKSGAILKVKSAGHEVGYHYEVLSKCGGDNNKAIELFKCELERLRELADVRTICMHGVPLSKHVNSDIWKEYDFHDYGIIGDAYLSVGGDFYYFSDSGRSWDPEIKVKDIMPSRVSPVQIKCTDDLIRLIKTGTIDRLYILSHPDEWSAGTLEWDAVWLRESLFNAGKKAIRMVRQ